MNNLIFDIECCDGKHICEFGYVITNEKFEVLDKQVITINPEKPFNLTGRKNQDDLILFFSQEEYYNSPTFPTFYDKIRKLLEKQNQIIIGHAIGNDAAFLRKACQRYKLEPLNFSFVDSQKMYSEFANEKKEISLQSAEYIFDLDKPEYLHKSDDDALLTIQLIQNMCKRLERTLEELITLCPTACGKSHNFNIMYTGNSLREMLEALDQNINSLSNNKKQLCIRKFSEKVRPEGSIVHSRLTGTKICFSSQYEKNNVKDTLVLIQLLANHGCKYNTKVSENDFYVPTTEEMQSEEVQENTRFYSATRMDGGRKVELILLDDLLKILGLTKDELDQKRIPQIEGKKKNYSKANPYYSTGDNSTTLGDLLKAQGIDLSKIS